jgi:molybdopterin synthase catalytic subunit
LPSNLGSSVTTNAIYEATEKEHNNCKKRHPIGKKETGKQQKVVFGPYQTP